MLLDSLISQNISPVVHFLLVDPVDLALQEHPGRDSDKLKVRMTFKHVYRLFTYLFVYLFNFLIINMCLGTYTLFERNVSEGNTYVYVYVYVLCLCLCL